LRIHHHVKEGLQAVFSEEGIQIQGGVAAQSGLVALVQPLCQKDHSLVELFGGKGVVLEWFEFSGHST